MARTRYIRHGFFRNEQLADCDPLTRILFAGLWVIADKEGRLEDRPKRIKADVLPYDTCDVEAMLKELGRRGFIVQYQVGGIPYISIPTWHQHQKVHHTEAASIIPAPPDNVDSTEVQLVDNGDLTVKSTLDNGSLTSLNLNVNLNSNGELKQTSARRPVSEAELVDNFAAFAEQLWEGFPRNSDGLRPGKKAKFVEALRKVPVADWDDVTAALEKYKQMGRIKRGIVDNAATWVKDGIWRECLTAQPIVEVYTNGSTGPRNNRSEIITRAVGARIRAANGVNQRPDNPPRLGPGTDAL